MKRWACCIGVLGLLALPLAARPVRFQKPPPMKVPDVVTVIMANPESLPARAPAGELLRLQDCIDYAGKHHPVLLAALAQVDQRMGAVEAIYSLFLPSFSLDVQKNYAGQVAKDVPGGLAQQNSLGLALNQTLFDFYKRQDRVRGGRKSLAASIYDLMTTYILQVAAIRQAYYNVVLQEYLRAIQTNILALYHEATVAAQGQYRGGIKTLTDVLQAQSQEGSVRNQLVQTEANLRNARYALAQTSGMPYEMVHNRTLEDVLSNNDPVPTLQEAVPLLVDHPASLSFEYQAGASLFAARAEAKEALPTLSTNGSYSSATNPSLVIPNSLNYLVGLQLSVPLFANSIVEPNVRQQEAFARLAWQNRENQQLLLRQQLATSLSDYDGSRIRQTVSRENVGLAARNFYLAFRRYQMGLSTVIELTQAGQFLISAQTSLVQSMADAENAFAQVELSIGRPAYPLQTGWLEVLNEARLDRAPDASYPPYDPPEPGSWPAPKSKPSKTDF